MSSYSKQRAARYARMLDSLPTEFMHEGFLVRHDVHNAQRPWSLYHLDPAEGQVWLGCFQSASDAVAEADAMAEGNDGPWGQP